MLVGTFNSNNSTSYTLSAGNYDLPFHRDDFASEFTSGSSFNFHTFNSLFIKSGKNPINTKWLEWFIGFAEGDGAIFADKNISRIRFILTQKESEVLVHIQKTFGFGIVRHYNPNKGNGFKGTSNGFSRWVVEDFNSLV